MRMISTPSLLIRISEALLHLRLALLRFAFAVVLSPTSRGHSASPATLTPDTGEPIIMDAIICLEFIKRSSHNLRLYIVAWHDGDG
jgi:hypothetical protein